MSLPETHPAILMYAPEDIGDQIQSLISARCNLLRLNDDTPSTDIPKFINDSGTMGVVLATRDIGQGVRQIAAGLEASDIPYLLAIKSADQAHLMFEFCARDYVLLSMPDFQIRTSLDRFLNGLEIPTASDRVGSKAIRVAEEPAFWVRSGHAERKVYHSAIRAISADRDYAVIELDDTSLLIRATMSSLEADLEGSNFIRIHRSHIIPQDDIREVRTLGPNRHEIRLKGNRTFPVGRTYWPRIRAMLRQNGRRTASELRTG